jgi:hypothetical protein
MAISSGKMIEKKTHGLIISYYKITRDVDIMANGVYIYIHTSNNLTLGYDPGYMYVDIIYIYIHIYIYYV